MTALRPGIVQPVDVQHDSGWDPYSNPRDNRPPAGGLEPNNRADQSHVDQDRVALGGVDLNRVDLGRVDLDGVDVAPVDAAPPPQRIPPEQIDHANLIRLHESIGTAMASRGEWREAYQHLRSALDLAYAERPVPEQLRYEVAKLRREHAEAHEQSIRDSLTASFNRRYLDERLSSMGGEPVPAGGLAVALVDLDWFKQVNDTFGHLAGDRTLRRVVDLLQHGLPAGAFCARYGGEEFVLVMPGIDAGTAVAVCEAARDRIERYPWSRLMPGLRVTVSIGLVHDAGPTDGRPGPRLGSAEQQLLRADGLLYAAKCAGRNAVAYRHHGRVLLAGAASGRRSVARASTVRHV